MPKRGLGAGLGILSVRKCHGYLQLGLVISGPHPYACQMEAVDGKGVAGAGNSERAKEEP